APACAAVGARGGDSQRRRNNLTVVPAKAGTHRATHAGRWNMGSRLRGNDNGEMPMPRVVRIDHLVLSARDFARSRALYRKLLGFRGFKLSRGDADGAGWSGGKPLFRIAAAGGQGRKRKYGKGDSAFHPYAFELASRNEVDALGAFLEENGMTVVDP